MGFEFCSQNEDRDFKLQLNPFITNSSVRPKALLKASFRYNRVCYKPV
jgi:hypothetical protein